MKSLYKAKIYHKRFSPKVNEFTYSGFYISFSLSEITKLKSKIFSVNKFNLFSFYEKDHGYKDERSLHSWIENQLAQAGIKDCDEFVLQTFPRIIGYVFNPVSFWYCYKKGELIATVSEVNNTFGESHTYLINGKKGTLPKEFHVSPFYPRTGEYRFNFTAKNRAIINYFDNNQLQLTTSIIGKEVPWSDKKLLNLFITHPLYTLFVVFLIHFQALKLFIKKIKFYTQPKKMRKEITYELKN